MDTILTPVPDIAIPSVKTEFPAEVNDSPTGAYRQIGVSRPALEIVDLPTPEQAFNVRRVRWQELIFVILGPSVIALGISIGSGEWILGPLNIGRYGFKGVFWVILVSTILQVFYNVELARYTLATGETPVVGFGRTPPGFLLWIPLAVLSFFAAFILGSWAESAGNSLYSLIVARPLTPEDLEKTRLIGIGLMFTVFGMLLVGRKIERTMEAIQGLFLPYILIGLLMVTVVVVPASYIGEAVTALVIPARPPTGIDITLLGSLAGFAALASGLNYMVTGYYRDKGYGMGHYTGYLSTLFNKKPVSIAPVGKTFVENEENHKRWNRWFRILLIDQWGVYFPGALLGIVLPCILFGYLISSTGTTQLQPNSMIFTTSELLGQRYGQLVSGWVLLIGFVILYTTQIGILELLARNLTDSLYCASENFRRLVHNDPRRFYYLALLVLILIISGMIHVNIPESMNLISGNLANFAAMIFPLALIYLNRQLPRPARIGWWPVLVLVLNILFFGFFFVNFVYVQITGTPLLIF